MLRITVPWAAPKKEKKKAVVNLKENSEKDSNNPKEGRRGGTEE